MRPILILSLFVFALVSAQDAAPSTAAERFDFMLGQWRSKSAWMNPDQTYRKVRSQHVFTRAFGGQGLIDDNYDLGEPGDVRTYTGTAIRTYDGARDVWICRWFDGQKHSWGPEFELRWEHDRMHGSTAGRDGHGAYMDTIDFHPMDADRVQWTMVRRYEGLDRAMVIGEIDYRRVAPGQADGR